MNTYIFNKHPLFSLLIKGLFLSFFLLIGTLPQAVEKEPGNQSEDHVLFLEQASKVHFNPEYKQYIEQSIDQLLQRRGFNGSVLLAHKGEVVYNKSRGYSRYRGKEEFAEGQNIFQLASVSKQFTAFAILMLYEKGLLGIDDFVADHIEGFPYPTITIRHLLNHTSGLQNYFYVIDNFWNKERIPNHQDMLDLFISRSLPLNFTPGRRFSYSNTGYTFLAMIVEKVSGLGFSEFIQENIFDPLGMENSFVFSPYTDLEKIGEKKNLTKGHERVGRYLREIPVDPIDGITGDKGVFASAEDLLIWDNALENNLLVSEATRQMAFLPGNLRSGYRFNYGFGFRIKYAGKENIVYHNGWWKGYRTAYIRLPGNTLLVILNNTTASITGLERQITRIAKNSPVPVFAEPEQKYLMVPVASLK